MPYALDPSALGLVGGGFLSPASRLNAGGNCASVICVCTARTTKGATLCARLRRGVPHCACDDDEGRWIVHARMTKGARSCTREEDKGHHTVHAIRRR